ncbi:MAG: AAA family ATPase [Marinilabiliaceae bacterium]
MGIYVNPDNEAFLTSLNTKPYVDKSSLIGVLNENVNTNHANICVSRPRRFGKTMAVEMAYAYYSKGCDSRKLFEKLEFSKSEGWDRYLNKFNVIRLDLISSFDRDGTTEDKLKLLNNKVLHELKKEFNSIDLSDAKDIIDAISVISNETKEKFVIIIDEYDFPIRTRATSQDLKPYLSFLNRLFKNSDLKNAIALAYLTGILPPIADRVESKLNNFTIFTMIEPDEMAPYFGFTSSEVEQLCEQYGLDYNECCRWYDGYKLSKSELCVYNPLSVVEAIRNRECRCYWLR